MPVMKKAVNLIRMKIDGAVREIKPGTHFLCPDNEIEFLTRAGAITDPKVVTATEVVVDEPAEPETEAAAEPAEPETEAAAEPAEPETESPDPDSMDQDELLAYASKLGLHATRRMKVETVREKIKGYLASLAETDNDIL